MGLPVPNLDDRRFQQLVDDAKRLVQQRCPQWTDHNVSDPGVTLIELFAWMTDQLLYRLNRVPDLHYVKFLELIGVKLFPPTSAHTPVTFWLSAPQPSTVVIPAGTRVATVRTETEDAIVFGTVEDLALVATSLERVASLPEGGEFQDHREDIERKRAFLCFSQVPKAGDALLLGLGTPVPSCAVTLRFSCDIEGVGVDPDRPPLAWEAWDGEGWSTCELERDTTGGLNRDGDVVLHVPSTHARSNINRQAAGWLRARVIAAEAGVPGYEASPNIKSVSAFTVGGTVIATNADEVVAEVLGASDGGSGQRFALARRPVVPSAQPTVLEVSSNEGWQEWTEVADFAASGADDRHFVLDAVAGEVALGPAVRLSDGQLRLYGAVPTKGAQLRVRSYRTGGGQHGNVARGVITVLKSSIPYVARVVNRHPGQGGVDGEDIENAKIRGPLMLRTRGRAVTPEDYEQLAREAAPEVARVRCVPAGEGADAGSVRVLIVPAVTGEEGRLRFDQLVPAAQTLARIAARLDECRIIGARVLVEPPVYRGVTIVARMRARPRSDPARLQADALAALYRYFHPVSGGPEGTGWGFGRLVVAGEVHSVLQQVPGADVVEDVRLFGADPVTGQRGQAVQRLELEPHALVFSYEHQVLVEEG